MTRRGGPEMPRRSWRVSLLVAMTLVLGWGCPGPAQARDYAAGSGPYSVAVGDFNGDHKPDLVVANSQAGTLSVLLGNGDGTLQPPSVVATFAPDTYLIPIAVGDVNGDGKQDLITASVGNVMVAVMLGNGDGTFQPAQIYPFIGDPESIVVRDFNGD